MGVQFDIVVVWSLGVQAGIVLLLAIFFSVLARAVPLVQVRLWAQAWLADLIAILAVFLMGALGQPATLGASSLAFWPRVPLLIYVSAKTLYALLLARGVRLHFEPALVPWLRRRHLLGVALVWGVIVALAGPQPMALMSLQWLVVGGVLALGAVQALRQRPPSRARWFIWIVFAEGLMFLAYVPIHAPMLWGEPPLLPIVLYSSFIDAGAELLVALAALVALEVFRSDDLQRTNRQLQASQDRLRQLVSLDPLTQLSNRRGLREALDTAAGREGVLIYLDVDDFKHINDTYGHAMGDACLERVAAALRQVFRAEDGLFRMGGDEFLVLAVGMQRPAAEERLRQLRQRLSHADGYTVTCNVSAGIVELSPEHEPERALELADDRMYRAKRARATAAAN